MTSTEPQRGSRGRRTNALIGLLAMLCSTIGPTQAHAVHPKGAQAARIGADWPMFHGDSTHSGVTSDSAIGASTVAGLSLRWQANVGQSDTSPVVVYNSALGKTLVYVGTTSGMFAAYDALTGSRVWSYKVNAPIYTTPAVNGNTVYFGSNDHYLYALNAGTGGLICRRNTGSVIFSSPVVADPDGNGKVVYLGTSGLNGSDDGGALVAINAVDPNPAANCSVRWTYKSFGAPAGSQPLVGVWSPPAFARDVNGRALVVFGGGSPEGAVYALNATTGARVWRFQTAIFGNDQDVGAGPTISPPGVNGFVDGTVYVAGKDSILYALNLRTGSKRWEFRIRDDGGPNGYTRSTAALLGRTLFLRNGPTVGLYAIDAITGAKVWSRPSSGSEGVSSPAISGGSADRVMIVADDDGIVSAHDPGSGTVLWSYDTGNTMRGSPAVSGGMLFVTNWMYLSAFSLGGGVSAQPQTTITTPADGSTVSNPNGQLPVSGSASDDAGISSVLVSIRDVNAGRYWDAAAQTWKSVLTLNPTQLASPGAPTTGWSTGFPAPPNGGPFVIQAEAVDTDAQHDPTVASSKIVLTSLNAPPDTAIGSPLPLQIIMFPNGRQSFDITITGTASDAAGAHPGVAEVWVVVQNREHLEYFCGAAGCGGGGETNRWRSTWTKLPASLWQPGAGSTAWSLTFSSYDHPHSYRITAWAIDGDGNADPVRAVSQPVCVQDLGSTAACA